MMRARFMDQLRFGFLLRLSIVHLAAATLFAVAVLPASGADIRRTQADELRYVGDAQLIFEGEIEPGDYDKLLRLIAESCADSSDCLNGVFLASPGGNLFEAMKIGRLVRRLRLETRLPSDLPPPYRQKAEAALQNAKADYGCLSACFFIFVAGVDRGRDMFPPILGIHHPSLLGTDPKKMKGSQTMASAGQMLMVVEDYLEEMDVPTRYANLMFSVPIDRLHFIDNKEFEKDFKGNIPELRDWLAKCSNVTDVERVAATVIEGKKKRGGRLTPDEERTDRTLSEKNVQQGDCLAQAWPKLREDAWKQFNGQ